MKTYLNTKTDHGVETVDELDSSDFPKYMLFRAELKRLIAEYQLAGMDVYQSGRATEEWRNR